ncbi:MAG: HIT family protein [Nanoarchaeota archaeon]
MQDCIFCKIVNGQMPCEKIYEDENILAFMDISPANKGHALIIPKEHYETILELPQDLMEKVAAGTKKVAEGVVKASGVEGFNVLVNNKKVAGQLVPHVHFHVIPRFEDDGIDMTFTHKKYGDGEIGEYAQKIKEKLA